MQSPVETTRCPRLFGAPQEGKPKRALKAFQKAVKLDPDNAGYW